MPCLAPVHSPPPSSEVLGSLTFGFSTAAPAASVPTRRLGKDLYQPPICQICGLSSFAHPSARWIPWALPPCQHGYNGLFPFSFQNHLSRLRHRVLFNEALLAPLPTSHRIPILPQELLPGNSRARLGFGSLHPTRLSPASDFFSGCQHREGLGKSWDWGRRKDR